MAAPDVDQSPIRTALPQGAQGIAPGEPSPNLPIAGVPPAQVLNPNTWTGPAATVRNLVTTTPGAVASGLQSAGRAIAGDAGANAAVPVAVGLAAVGAGLVAYFLNRPKKAFKFK